MEVIGLRPKNRELVILATEDEINLVSGLDDVVPIEGRISVGSQIPVSELWNRLKTLGQKETEMLSFASTLRTKADEIDAAVQAKVEVPTAEGKIQ